MKVKNMSCEENLSSKDKLFVFIGERLDVKTLPDRKDVNEAKFLAKYKILQKICGDFLGDSIKFEVIWHYADSSFKKNRIVLLFLMENKKQKDGYNLWAYLYYDLFETKNGNWASPYPTDDYTLYTSNETTSVRPKKIEFAQEVSYDISGMTAPEVDKKFPAPYYFIKENKAIAIYGNYVSELFQLQKDGILRDWRIYGIPDTLAIKEIEFEEVDSLKK